MSELTRMHQQLDYTEEWSRKLTRRFHVFWKYVFMKASVFLELNCGYTYDGIYLSGNNTKNVLSQNYLPN